MGTQHNPDSEFYVGYFPKAPASYRKTTIRVVVILFLLIPAIAFLLVNNQRGFLSSTYDYANITELSGTLITTPFPALQIAIDDGKGNDVFQTIPLVAFGKLGGQREVDRLLQDLDGPPRSVEVSVKGNLIFYDGKTLLEVKEWGEWSEGSNTKTDPVLVESQVSLTGEILDAKCFFGVMKPGHGKPHRSCAVRCISGGIPPVIAANDHSGGKHYYLLTGPENQSINTDLLPWVAQAVTLKGDVYLYDDWEVLQLNPETIDRMTGLPIDRILYNSITMCSD